MSSPNLPCSEPDHARRNGIAALRTLIEVLACIGWEPEVMEEEGLMRIDFEGDHLPISDAYVAIYVDLERFVFYLNFHDRVALSYRSEMMEFVTRANFALVTGNFEMDIEEGIVRFKSSIDFTGVELSERLIRNVISSARDAVEQYADVAVKVMCGEMGALDAIHDSEVDPGSP